MRHMLKRQSIQRQIFINLKSPGGDFGDKKLKRQRIHTKNTETLTWKEESHELWETKLGDRAFGVKIIMRMMRQKIVMLIVD